MPARDTYDQIWRELLAEVPAASPALAKRWVRDSFRELRERRHWSWLLKRHQIVIPDAYSTGTATFVQNSPTVTFSGATITDSMVGRQIRRSSNDPIYTIVSRTSATSVEIYPAWRGEDASGVSFSIFTAYVTMPDDFLKFRSVKDLAQGKRLRLDVPQTQLDRNDPRRSRAGSSPCVVSPLDYELVSEGSVYDIITGVQTGLVTPTSSGSYTGLEDAVYVVEILTTGASGVATYRWKKDNGAWVTATTSTSSDELQEGVFVNFPSGTYNDGDVFIIPTRAHPNPERPRFELYPHPTTARIIDIWYVSVYDDIDQPGVKIPRYVRGDVLRIGALGRAARWPGTETKPNPFAQINRATSFEEKFNEQVNELERQDNEIFQTNVFQSDNVPYAPLPWSDGGDQFSDPDWYYERL